MVVLHSGGRHCDCPVTMSFQQAPTILPSIVIRHSPQPLSTTNRPRSSYQLGHRHRSPDALGYIENWKFLLDTKQMTVESLFCPRRDAGARFFNVPLWSPDNGKHVVRRPRMNGFRVARGGDVGILVFVSFRTPRASWLISLLVHGILAVHSSLPATRRRGEHHSISCRRPAVQ